MNINTVKDLENSYLVNNYISVPKNPTNRDYRKVQEWLSIEGNSVLPEYTLSELKDIKIAEIKAEAGNRITEIYPEWRQRNHMAAVADIHNKELIALKTNTIYTLTAEELAIIDTAKTTKAQIFNIRSKSDLLEASLDGMTIEQLEAFDATDDNKWV